MSEINLTSCGITGCTSMKHNISYEELFNLEIDSSKEGFEKGKLTKLGAVSVDTGAFTGRSPKDKYFVKEASSADHLWWASEANGSDNKPISPETWNKLKALSVTQLSGKDLFVQDAFCGANPTNRIRVRLITEVAWAAHFAKNMFIRPNADELPEFVPDWTILHSCKAVNPNWKSMGLNSEVYVAFNISEKMTLIGGTWYGGEIKKGIFSMMNYFLPLKGVGSFHCSANVGENGNSAMFFGLSGTGKTTLSTDPKRQLIGDDEHGWDEEGIFNFEGGCYAKTINLSRDKEPDIYNAIKRDALLENVVVDGKGNVDFDSSVKTQNTRVSYPINHIENIVKPSSIGPPPKHIIFLTCDAFGVLPPVAILNKEQAMYQYLSGYTAKVAGTERGITEPKATFSAGFGGPFLTLHPIYYTDILGSKIEKYETKVYLVNTGWTGGGYGVGSRIPLGITRKIIDSILNDSITQAALETMPVFNFQIPKTLNGIDSTLLNPSKTWSDPELYKQSLDKLAGMFLENFKKFIDLESVLRLANHGPQV